ncbi:hypothetical protein [Spiroplasma endosymbiont of Polydrusus formosus]
MLFINSSYEILDVLIKTTCGHDIEKGVTFSSVVNNHGHNF